MGGGLVTFIWFSILVAKLLTLSVVYRNQSANGWMYICKYIEMIDYTLNNLNSSIAQNPLGSLELFYKPVDLASSPMLTYSF